jgi:hypothetical protein
MLDDRIFADPENDAGLVGSFAARCHSTHSRWRSVN